MRACFARADSKGARVKDLESDGTPTALDTVSFGEHVGEKYETVLKDHLQYCRCVVGTCQQEMGSSKQEQRIASYITTVQGPEQLQKSKGDRGNRMESEPWISGLELIFLQ